MKGKLIERQEILKGELEQVRDTVNKVNENTSQLSARREQLRGSFTELTNLEGKFPTSDGSKKFKLTDDLYEQVNQRKHEIEDEYNLANQNISQNQEAMNTLNQKFIAIAGHLEEIDILLNFDNEVNEEITGEIV
jgi:predicted nuclease with TOPRIM domain